MLRLVNNKGAARVIGGLLAALLLAAPLLLPSAAMAIVPNAPNPATCTTDGVVYDTATANGVTYIVGDFDNVVPPSGPASPRGNVAAIDEATGAVTDWDPIVTGGAPTYVKTVTVDGDYIYIGGLFNNVDATYRENVACLDSSGNLQTWAPHPDNDVNDMVVEGNYVYLCGNFGLIDMTARPRAACVTKDPTTYPSILSWNPLLNGQVNCLEIDGDYVYMGGLFTGANYVDRYEACCYTKDPTTPGTLQNWDPNVGGAGEVCDLAVDGEYMYIAGNLTSIRGTGRVGGGCVTKDPTTAGTLQNWSPNAFSAGSTYIRSLSIAHDCIYLGGRFDFIRGSAISLAAAYSKDPTQTGNLLSWNAGFNGSAVYVVNYVDSRLYVGGLFNTVGGSARPNFAEFNEYFTPTVLTKPATSINGYGALLNGNIVDTGGDNPDMRAFQIREVGSSGWSWIGEGGEFDTGPFAMKVDWLASDTEYEYQALAYNAAGEGSGSIMTFRTVARPTSTTNPASLITETSATLNGSITATGRENPDQYGFRYRPTGTTAWTNWSQEGSFGIGGFSHSQMGLVAENSYDFQAMAHNSAGWSYGSTMTFRTMAVQPAWYLAEGTNAWGFSTYLTIENANNQLLHAKVTYMNPNPPTVGKGAITSRTIALPPLSQTTVSSMGDIGAVDFSTKVECLEGKPIAVDRTMFWTGARTTARGYHSSIGTREPSKTWYLPEGSSAWGFETWTAVLNPTDRAADLTLRYMTETGGPKTVNKTLPANSRATYSMAADIGVADASIEVISDVPVVAERSMYDSGRREGSCSIGAPAPAADFYLSEGATGYTAGFTTYVLVQNPNNAGNKVTFTFQTGAGQVAGPAFTMPPNSRKTVRLNDFLPANTDVSTQVHGSKPLVAERAMYWDVGTGQCFHSSIGLAQPYMTFMCPDGQVGQTLTYTLVQNPNPGAVTVRITYLPHGGGKVTSFTAEVPKESRATFNMADKIKSGRAAILVESLDGARPVMVERSMYGSDWGSGTNTVGAYGN
jgi:hypothetical protein